MDKTNNPKHAVPGNSEKEQYLVNTKPQSHTLELSRLHREAIEREMQETALARELAEKLKRELENEIAERRYAEDALQESQAKFAHELEDTKQLQKISSLLVEDEKSSAYLYEQILDVAMAIMHADFSSIQILDIERSELRFLAWRNFHPESAAFWEKISVKTGTPCSSALQRGERTIVSDLAASDYQQNTESFQHYQLSGITAVQSTPLMTRDGRLIGMISTHWRQPHEPGERDLALFDVLARQMADMLERRRAQEALGSREAWLAGQKEAFQAALYGAPLEESLQVLVRTAITQMGEDSRCAFYIVAPNGQELNHIIGMPKTYTEAVGHFKIAANSFACGLAAHSGQPIIIPDVTQESRWQPWLALVTQHEFRACWSFPIKTKSDKVVGAFALYFKSPRLPTQRDHEFADVLMQASAIIISQNQEAAERARAEEALRESEVRFRALVLANSGMLMLYQMSADWSEMISLRSKDSIADSETPGRNWLEVYIPSHEQARVMEAINAAIHTKSVFELEHRIIQANSREGWVFSCAVPVLNNDGQIIEWFGAATDITKRKHIEQVLKETDRRKNEFLAMLAHELRNPLFPVKNAIYLLQNSNDNTTHHQQLIQMMERQVNHMVRLVDDLLEGSRIATGKIELRRERIDLVEVINNAIEVSQPLLDGNQHQLILSLPPGPLWINADMIRMTQVFANLLNNAAKYTPENGIITVHASHENNHLIVSVRDNGIGISAEMLPNVFEMFTQDKYSIDRNNKGLGIGLAMVRKLVELHGGTVKVYSSDHNYNQGSEFIVCLPLEAESSTKMEENKIAKEKNPSLANLRVLIADDNPDITSSFAMLLSSWEIKVHAVTDGKSVLAALPEFNPHIILLDIGMPDMDGYEVAEKIRKNPQYDSVKLVALTGWSQAKDRAKSQTTGFSDHLAKPVDINALRKILIELTE